jgi:hypothetical protein
LCKSHRLIPHSKNPFVHSLEDQNLSTIINQHLTQVKIYNLQSKHIVTCMGGTHDGVMGSSSDDWIYLALWLQSLLVTLSHNPITVLHILQLLHINPHSLFPPVITTFVTLHKQLRAALHCTDGTCKSSNHMLTSSFHGSSLQLLKISAAFNSNGLLLKFSTELMPATDCSYRLHKDPTENTASVVGEACLLSRFLAIEV